jgi:hypothetical protein
MSAGYNWPQGNVSEIFTYLNAGGPNVKYTKFTYNARTYTTTSYVNANTSGQDIEWDRNLQGENIFEVEIYWGKYTKFNLNALGGSTSNLFFDISELSGETNAASRNLSFSSSGNKMFEFYPEIDLDTRRITKLPRYRLDGEDNGHKLCDHTWKIETDDFEHTSTANPDTNTDTDTDTDTDTETDTSASQTGGIKISELDKITSFDPADLMIISRDEDNNGTYDKSFAIDPTLLRDSARSNIGTEKPSDPKNGEFWFDENTANLYIYTEALNSWIQI